MRISRPHIQFQKVKGILEIQFHVFIKGLEEVTELIICGSHRDPCSGMIPELILSLNGEYGLSIWKNSLSHSISPRYEEEVVFRANAENEFVTLKKVKEQSQVDSSSRKRCQDLTGTGNCFVSLLRLVLPKS